MNYRFADTDSVKRPATRGGVKSAAMKDLSQLEAAAAAIEAARESLAQLEGQRDKLIVQARKDGYTWPSLAIASRLSRQGVDLVARRANRGELPKPRQQS